jgi:hypothetical protein
LCSMGEIFPHSFALSPPHTMSCCYQRSRWCGMQRIGFWQ